jgi:DNA-directed RNA polymerase subunit M/transcription elongation factor TFIIS
MVSCDKCKHLLVYRQKDGTASLAKNQRSCQHDEITSSTDLSNQTKVTEYYSSLRSHNISKNIKEKVKMACTEFAVLDSRSFERLLV